MLSKGKQNGSLMAIPKINIVSPTSTTKDIYADSRSQCQSLSGQNYGGNVSTYSSVVKKCNLEQNSLKTQPKMKLKDYLLLTNISTSKQAEKRRKIKSQAIKSIELKKTDQSQPSQSSQKKVKYTIGNNQMSQFLKKQIQKQLQSSVQEILQLKKLLMKQIKNEDASNDQMMMMYELRSLVKQQLNSVVEKMKKSLMSQVPCIDESVQEEFDFNMLIEESQKLKKKGSKKTTRVHFENQC